MLLLLTATASSGCQSNLYTWYDSMKQKLYKGPPPPPPPVDNLVLRGSGLEQDKDITPGSVYAELEGAKTLYAQGKYAEAEKHFHRIAHNSKNPPAAAEEALFFEGDCQYLQGHYPRAESTFKKLVKEFRLNGRFHEQATRRLFDIANYWLDDTRKSMKQDEERREGKGSWFVMPASFVHFDKEKPLLDEQGRAIEALEEVRLNDVSGPLGERALFYIATVKFYNKDFKEADYYYSQVYENFPNGKLAATALKHAIICKQMMTGGSVYDLRSLDQARKLIQEQARAYPELGKDEEFLRRQLVSISHQQADKDWRIAEFYRRTGHPGSAYFYYELVKRRYPGTSYSEKAIKRLDEMAQKLAKQKSKDRLGESPVDFSAGNRGSIFGGFTPGSGMPGMSGIR